MDEGNRYNSENDLGAERRLIERSPTCSQPMFQPEVKVDSLFEETSQKLQPSHDSFLADFTNDEGILDEEQHPAIKKIRLCRFVGKAIDQNKEEMFSSALPDENGMCVTQCHQSRQLCFNYACEDPQFEGSAEASSFDPWSQDFNLQADRISRACLGRRRHATCEELDNTACLIRNRRMSESFNLSNISDELEMLTGSRKRKRSAIEEH